MAENIDTRKQVSIRATQMILPPVVAPTATEIIWWHQQPHAETVLHATATKLILPTRSQNYTGRVVYHVRIASYI